MSSREAMMGRLGLGRSWAHVAFLSSGGAAAVHLAAARPHLDEWAPAGAFMIACGLAQAVWAMWIVRDQRDAALTAGMALNGGTIGLWLVTRTVGLPFGPNAGTAEHVHPTDALATALEVLAVAAVLAIVAKVRPHRAFALLAGLVALVGATTAAHDPLREGATAAATLTLLLAGRILSVSVPVPDGEKARRDHVGASIVRRYVVGVRDAGRAGLGAGRSGAHQPG